MALIVTDSRAASIFPSDIEDLEMAGDLLYRNRENLAGLRLHALALRLRGQTGIQVGSQVFRCDIDESAGLAEVVELSGYSRRVPCR